MYWPPSPVSVEGPLAEVHLVDMVEHDPRLEALGVFQETLHQRGAQERHVRRRASCRPGGGGDRRPWAMPVISSGFRFARARRWRRVQPAGAGAEDENAGVWGDMVKSWFEGPRRRLKEAGVSPVWG